MSYIRWLAAFGAVVLALVVQVSLFPHVAWHGIVPNRCLLVVVAAALVAERRLPRLLAEHLAITVNPAWAMNRR